MAGCEFRPHRHVFPIGQDVNGDEVDGLVDLAVAQPEFPDIGIGDGHLDLRLDRADVGGEIGRRHLAAQQHLIADHQRGNDAGILLGQADRGRNLGEVLGRLLPSQMPCNHLQPDLGGLRRNLIEPVLDRIGADAVGDSGELRQVLRDLFRLDHAWSEPAASAASRNGA